MPSNGVDRARVLQVQRDGLFAAIDDRALAEFEHAAIVGVGALDQDDFGAHIGEQHAAKRTGPDTRYFNDADSVENTHGSAPLEIKMMSRRSAGRSVRRGEAKNALRFASYPKPLQR
jgi:hypothetical protein